jgi:DNA-binding NarL/FixJ family response regulator
VTIRVLLADDNPFVREGMRIILSTFEGFEVAAAVEDGEQAADYCERHEVDVALLDVQMPKMNGVEAAKRITERTRTRVLILTTFDDDEYIEEAIRNGAMGYLLKNNDPEKIRDAIRTVHNGHHVLQHTVLEKLTARRGTGDGGKAEERKTEGRQTDDGGPDGCGLSAAERGKFTERELEVMARIAEGLTNREIARALYLSEGTVANHITSILGKTGMTHRTQIAIYYLTGAVRP